MRKRLGLALVIAGALPVAAHAQGLDVEAATRAYLDLLSGPARAKSDAYFEGGYWLILAAGWSGRLRNLAERVSRRRWLVPAIYGLLLTPVAALILLPWSIYTDFVREAQYGLTNQSFAAWAGDWAKSLLIGAVINALLAMAIYAVIRRAPRRWWVAGMAISGAFLMIGALIGPVFIAPMFNTYTEMPAGPLRERIVAVARANQIPAEHIYVSDASRQTKRISANVSGLGPTIRITLNDNLLKRTGPDEVLAVMGHEMGHYVLGHIFRILFVFTLGIGVMLFLMSRIAPRLIARHPRWGVRDIADPASAPVLLMLSVVWLLAVGPLINNFVRWNESEADVFGLNAARAPDGFAKVALRLSEYRKLEPSRLEELLFYDHPSGEARIRMAMQWKKDHVPNATMAKPELVPAP